jgi:hypothetical protein
VTIEVEDGSGNVGAQSYLSVADADDYFALRGVESWAEQDTAAKEAALVRATFALDSWLRGRWLGKKKTQAQALAWPRTGVLDEDGYELPDTSVPAPVRYATAEVALIELTERFIQESVSKDNTISSESVGPISVSYRADAPTMKSYPHIEALVRGVATVGGVSIGMNVYLSDAEKASINGEGSSTFDFSTYFNGVKW